VEIAVRPADRDDGSAVLVDTVILSSRDER
jgi:hypothetical protein